jgi:hypothetical protein
MPIAIDKALGPVAASASLAPDRRHSLKDDREG